MRSYVDWSDTRGFYIRQTWDAERKVMGPAGKMVLFPLHRRIFGKLLTPDDVGKFPYETVLFSAIKKSAKTAIAASVAAWFLEESPAGTEIFVIANSKEHAEGLVMRDVQYHFQQRIEDGTYSDKRKEHNFINISQFRIELANGSFIQVLANSFKSSAGSRHSLTLWDELWGSTTELDRRMWDELMPIPTVNNSLRFVSTYAGFENESELLWELYLRGVGEDEHKDGQGKKIEGMEDLPCWASGNMFTYWTHEPTMPWQTEEFLDLQLANERPMAYIRLWTNNWVTSQEEFIPVAWWDSAAKVLSASADIWQDHPYAHWPIVIGVDAGIKRDSTALVGVSYDAKRGKVGIVFHRIWTPSKGDQVDLDATVEKELRLLYNKYKVVQIVYDPTHLMQTMLRLEREGLPVYPFAQSGSGMLEASQLLYDLFKTKNMEAYPDETLRKHIQMAVAEASARGFRIVKNKVSARHHIDGAVALAMACHGAVQGGGVDTSIPLIIKSPYTRPYENAQKDLPWELQT